MFVNDRENVALTIVSAGMARVRSAGGQQSPFYDDLIKAQDVAAANGLGVHTTDPEAIQNTVREFNGEFDAQGYFNKIGKDRPVSAIVEGALSGSMLKVTLLPEGIPAAVMVAGIMCPSMNRRSAPETTTTSLSSQKVEANGDGAHSSAPSNGPEPFAREARHLTELRCLGKEVQLILQGISQHGMLVATVHHPPAGSLVIENDTFEDLATALMQAGLGRAAEWSLDMMTSGAFKLRELERAARQTKSGIWHDYVPQKTNTAKLNDRFHGPVIEIVSGDTIIVLDSLSGVERRVNLSSIRAPRASTRDRPAESWGNEAKEFLRQRIIGKDVDVSLEYTRKIPLQAGSEETRTLSLGTVMISENSKSDEIKVNNVAELLLVRGLAQTVRHRGDEERSAHYEELVNAEDMGKKGKKGMWSSKEPPVARFNDLTAPGSGSKARQHLPFLQRAGKMLGVCEAVLGGSRLKIFIPKESVTIAFSPSGVRCPGKEEPFSKEALAFTRSRALQRDVRVEIESVDKLGTFLGSIELVNPPKGITADLAIDLLSSGLARLQVYGHAKDSLTQAQEKAKNAKKGIWQLQDSEESSKKAETITNGTENIAHERKPLNVVVTEVVDANCFYIQDTSEPRTQWITEKLSSAPLEHEKPPLMQLKKGENCIAKFRVDGKWYRARIQGMLGNDYEVFFIDYGNKDRVKKEDVRSMPADLSAVAPQAHQCTLAFTRAPGLNDDYGVEAAERLSELVAGGIKLQCIREAVKYNSAEGSSEWLLTLYPSGTDTSETGNSINSMLIKEGLCRVNQEHGKGLGLEASNAISDLLSQEDEARRQHLCLWRYGDPGDDDDDDGDFPALR